MPRPQKKVHIPLDFEEAVADLLKVDPTDPSPAGDAPAQDEPEDSPDESDSDD